MDPVVREIRPEEYEAFCRVDGAAFSYVSTDETIERQRPFWDTARKFGVFDGEQPVGVSANVALSMTVPGGVSVPTAGVTAVGVLPTHHRRGYLTAMMHRLFEDAREHGEPLAALYASESLIYGRYGYGVSIEHESWEIERERAAFAFAPEHRGALRMVDAATARAASESVWERTRARQPGMTARNAIWWHRRYDDKRENGPQFIVLYEEDRRCDGYVMYRVRSDWNPFHGSEATVIELIATTAVAEAALWQFVFSLDLVKTVRVYSRPVDDPVHHMLADPRRLIRTPRDGVWLRLVDAVPALEARTYAPGRLVMELRDEFCPWNGGRFVLESDGVNVSCRPSTADADVVVPTASLATAYLGGARFSALARAGRAEERTAGALRVADAMFASERAPWSPEFW